MANGVLNLIGRMADRRVLQRWSRMADATRKLDFTELRAARKRANDLRREIDRMCRSADERFAEPGATAAEIEAPVGADWRWRPENWRKRADPAGIAGADSGTQFASGISVFHDCRVSELTLRQTRNTAEGDVAAYGLAMDVFRFDGSFLSLALDLPQEALAGMTARHLVGLSARFRIERPLEIFARLNIRHGPNTEQLVREIPPGSRTACVEFDLAYAELNEKRLEKAWLDLIFEGPEMNRVEICDLTMYRRPRAEI